MKSNFEEQSKIAAVAAVERRWREKEEANKKNARRARYQRFMLFLGLLIIGVGGTFAALYKLGYITSFRLPTWDSLMQSKGADKEGLAQLDAFTDILQRFKADTINLWREAPSEIKPQSAAVGTVYHILLEKKKGGLGLYRMTSKGAGNFTVEEIVPFRKPITIKMSECKGARQGALQLIEHADKVYVSGTDTVSDGYTLRKRLLQ